jgi:ATP-dependent DNA ligase
MNLRDEIMLSQLDSTDQLRADLPLSGPVRIEPKLDGIRCTLQIDKDGAQFRTRSGKLLACPPWAKSLRAPFPVLLDGELVTAEGRSTVAAVMKRGAALRFVAFDCLLADWELTGEPLQRRLRHLGQRIEAIDCPAITAISGEDCDGMDVEHVERYIELARANNLEGYVVKPLYGVYDEIWGYKIKEVETLDGIICEVREEVKKDGKTGRAGTVGVAEIVGGPVLAWVPLPEADRCAIADVERRIVGRVLEFHHLGHGSELRRSCRFVRWRDGDKVAAMCKGWRLV